MSHRHSGPDETNTDERSERDLAVQHVEEAIKEIVSSKGEPEPHMKTEYALVTGLRKALALLRSDEHRSDSAR